MGSNTSKLWRRVYGVGYTEEEAFRNAILSYEYFYPEGVIYGSTASPSQYFVMENNVPLYFFARKSEHNKLVIVRLGTSVRKHRRSKSTI